MNDILGAYPDLLEEVNGFIDRSESAGKPQTAILLLLKKTNVFPGSLWSGNLPKSVKADDEDQGRERDVKTVSVVNNQILYKFTSLTHLSYTLRKKEK